MCDECMIRTAGVTQLRGNGDRIWECNIDAPKNFYSNLKNRALDPDKDRLIQRRAEIAKMEVLREAKKRRDISRYLFVKDKAKEYEIESGVYVSWGLGDAFDEYFGHVDNEKLPHGIGIKFYSDGTVYYGPWVNGFQKTDKKGTWIRPDGSQYEGQWLQGRKHGFGRQIYADETVYTGQYANGFEHGHGTRTYTDGSSFEGRFRFGRRDGPGVLTRPNGTIQKGNFRDALMTHEKPPPPVYEHEKDLFENAGVVYNPLPLTKLCLDQIAYALIHRQDIYPPALLQRRASDHLKPFIGESYMNTLGNISDEYKAAGRDIAFQLSEVIIHDGVRMKHADMEAFLYMQGANKALTTLRLSTNKMESAAVEAIGRKLPTKCWPNLRSLDLSFNTMDFRALKTLTEGILGTRSLQKVRLAGCKINHTTSQLVGQMLAQDDHIKELDLSFNMLGAKGAEDIANALSVNRILSHLNLRSNNIGPIGGMYIVDSLIVNKSVLVLCMSDNSVGLEVMTLLSGRLAGNLPNLRHSVKTDELQVPDLYRKPVRISEDDTLSKSADDTTSVSSN
eukprot:CAMPEP_0185032330 /NCGR_PEP_ID=MMETSP1103-20130426/20305_1 /TAXON_ID=36769 /ORGANISM="Paraphysomonas bandaiensis, Strain Caron Lab Isolate" /LENGTH=561 /DNA_ID=CAMNT_0027568181 /DNA_START=326 /DNA_END=2011 /DNA_ORIENTATION=+